MTNESKFSARKQNKTEVLARSICIYVGSGDPVRVLRLLHTTNTLDTLIAETYVQLVATELCATLLADPPSLVLTSKCTPYCTVHWLK